MARKGTVGDDDATAARHRGLLPRGHVSRVPPIAVVEAVTPQVDCGRFPVKRVVGETITVEAACFAHGHELVSCALRYRPAGAAWREVPMSSLGNDLWRAIFEVGST